MSVVKKGIAWFPVENDSVGTRVGGNAPDILMEHWPFFEGSPLPFLGQLVCDDEPTVYLFLANDGTQSWQPQNGANAVLVEGSWEVGDWIETKPVDSLSAPLYCEQAFAPETMNTSPKWLQGEEEQPGFDFIFQIPSQIDGAEAINIGNAYGDAYVFLSEDGTTGRMLWQA
ncbi:MAG: hypothetical protein H9W81_17315 [Enterococcus sp.]|nr:hypothetical protein [Enterococcus sp.]